MRFRVDVTAPSGTLVWQDVLGPCRGWLYGLLAEQAPALGAALHERGFGAAGMRPLGCSGPVFARQRPSKGSYAVGGAGSIWVASPVREIGGSLAPALVALSEVHWGGARWTVRGVALEPTPDFSTGVVEWATTTPVVLKGGGRDNKFLLPDDTEYEARLAANLRRKAEALGVPAEAAVEVVKAGPRRLFRVDGSAWVGATLVARVEAPPDTLSAAWNWGLGMGNIMGFGWVR
jgi:CRISPR-associated endoribonuclease Cas6